MDFLKTMLLKHKLRTFLKGMKPANRAWAEALGEKLKGKTDDQKIAILRTEIAVQGVQLHRVTERLENFHASK